MSSSASVKSLVNKATKDDREPASGFILQELAVRSNSIEECKNMYELILKKLSKDKPNIKKKCLRVVCYVSENGSSQWRRYWQGQTDKIKECSRYSGRADPIYGDTPYKDVRDLAAKTMEAIFSSTRKDTSAIASRMTSMSGGGETKDSSSGMVSSITARFKSGSFGVKGGSTSASSSSSSSESRKTGSGLKITTSRGTGARTKSGRELEGFGNTDYRPDPARIAEAKFTMMTQSPAYANPGQLGGDKHPWSTGELDAKTTRKGKRKKRRAGGVFADDSDGDDTGPSRRRGRLDDSDNDDDYDNDAGPSKRTAPTRKEAIRSDGKFERQWVDTIVTGGGVGVKIADLKSKVQQFETLSQSHVLEYLDDKLGQDLSEVSWQALAKCLVLLTSLVKDGNSADSVIDYFSDSPESVAELMQSKKAILRKHACAFADLVGISLEDDEEEEVDTQANERTVPAKSVAVSRDSTVTASADDLFDFAGGGDGGGGSASVASPAADLLSGLTISGGDGSGGPTSVTAADASGGSDLFGGMSVSSTGPTPSTVVSTTSGVPIEIASTESGAGATVTAAVSLPGSAAADSALPAKSDIFDSLMADPMMGLSTGISPASDLGSILGGGGPSTGTSVGSGTTTQIMSDKSVFGIDSGSQSTSLRGSGVDVSAPAQPTSGFGFVSATAAGPGPSSGASPALGGMSGMQLGGPAGVTPQSAAAVMQGGFGFGAPGAGGAGAAAMMGGGAAGMMAPQQWNQPSMAAAQPGGYGMMMGGGMAGPGMMTGPPGMAHGMMGGAPGMSGMMTQPPPTHPLFTSGGSTGVVPATGHYGSRMMGAPDPFATMMNPAPTVSKAPTEPDPFADLSGLIKM